MTELARIETRVVTAEAKADPQVRPGCEARIRWYGTEKTRTDVAIVYIHGFTASPEELRPVPDRVADALEANLFFARMTGHGQGGSALGRATLEAWRKDVARAIEIGHGIGRKVVLMGCSTGCTLNTLAALDGAELAGVIHISPNYAMSSRLVQWVVDAPGVRWWGPRLLGRERVIEPLSEAHDAYWTLRYPTIAVLPVAEATRVVRKANLGRITAPALFVYSQEDKIVSPAAIRATRARWGGKTAEHVVTHGPGIEENGHVVAGDVLSPGGTDEVTQAVLDWTREAL